MKKPKRKPDWLHGERDQQRIESTKEKWSLGGRVMSEEEAEEVTDANDKNWIERDAPYPEAQLNEALRHLQGLLAVLDPKRADLASPERERLHQNLLSQGLSEEEAQRECDKVSVRKDPSLRCARDAFDWLNAAHWRTERGRKKIAAALEATDIGTVRVRAIEAQNDFVEAISYALNGGRALGELKPRVHHDTKPGSKKKPHRKGKFGHLRVVTEEEMRRFAAEKRPLSTGDLRDAIASHEHGISFEGLAFHWKDDDGKPHKMSDKRWLNIVSEIRKVIPG